MNTGCFDEVISRRGTNCAKYDEMDEKYGKDILHCGVADMDFRAPEPIREACRKVTDHEYMAIPIFRPVIPLLWGSGSAENTDAGSKMSGSCFPRESILG